MKKLFVRIVGIIALFSCGSFAQNTSSVIQSDLPERLRIESEGFIKDISTLNDVGLIEAADSIVSIGVSNDALYSVVEKKINEKYQEHLSNPKNDTIAKEISALIRALASLDPKASGLLHKMDESKSRGVRERAVRLLPKLHWFSQRNSLMQKPDFYQPEQKLMTHRLLNLIVSDDPTMRRYASEEINRLGGSESIIYKKMAERLEKDKATVSGNSSVEIDAYAWFCRILRDYDQKSSAQLLSSIQNDSAVHVKIKKYTH